MSLGGPGKISAVAKGQGQESRLRATYGAGLYRARYTHDLMSFSQQHCEGVEKSPLFHRGGDQACRGCIVVPVIVYSGHRVLAHILSLDPLQRNDVFYEPE